MFKKIMVATDGSQTAGAAVDQAAQLASLADTAEVLVFHVCSGCSTDVDLDGENLHKATLIVDQAAEAFKDTRANVQTRVESEYPPESVGTAIVDTASKEKADLIVLGSRGLSEFQGILLGSVSSKVVQHAACPVLVVKQGEKD